MAADQYAHQAAWGTGTFELQRYPVPVQSQFPPSLLQQGQKRWAPKVNTGCLTCRLVAPKSINSKFITLFDIKYLYIIGDVVLNATRPNLFASDALNLHIIVKATILLIIPSQPPRHLFLARTCHYAMPTTELLALYYILWTLYIQDIT
jgi:hypothetical protein